MNKRTRARDWTRECNVPCRCSPKSDDFRECSRARHKWLMSNCPGYAEAQAVHSNRTYKKKRYNISLELYNVIRIQPCNICGATGKNVVDHNHNTGEVRGILCEKCNKGIGQLGDSIETLQKAIRYLQDRGSYA